MTRREVLQASVLSLAQLPVAPQVGVTDLADADLKLTLVGAVARRGGTGQDRSDILFDIYRRGRTWQNTAWGWANRYNTADHEATVAILEDEKRLRVELRVTFGADPLVPVAAGHYDVTLQQVGNRYEGTYRGAFEAIKLSGKAVAELRSPFPALPPAGFAVPLPGEHPRLIFRKASWEEIRRRAETSWGHAVITVLRRQLTVAPENLGETSSNAAYHASGQAFLYQILGDKAAMDAARSSVEQLIQTPPSRTGPLDTYADRLLGLALAYDFAYDTWDAAFRQNVAHYIEETASQVLTGSEPGVTAGPGTHWISRTRSSAGIALLAIQGDSPSTSSGARMLALCERAVVRYLAYGMGDKGFGAEGDSYHARSMEMLYPFVHALRVATGREMAVSGPGDPLNFGLPLYVQRSFEVGGKPTFHCFGSGGGTARETPRSLFALGMASVKPAHIAAIRDFIDHYDGPIGLISAPHHAAYALALYPEEIVRRPASVLLPSFLQDTRQGFFVFRSEDFVATLYAKAAASYGTNLPEAGTFRLHGLGTDWAVRASLGERERENVVLVNSPLNRAEGNGRVLFAEGRPDGSGAVSLDLSAAFREGSERKDLGIRVERAFLADYSGKCGAPALFVLADRLRGGAGYTWLWHTMGESVITTDRGFSIQGAGGATLRATFLSPESVVCTMQEQNGIHTIAAMLPGAKSIDFQVVITIQQGPAPSISITGRGRDRVVHIGAQEIRLETVSRP